MLDDFDGFTVARLTVESCLRLDVRKLWRRGYRPGVTDIVYFEGQRAVRIEVQETSIRLVHSFGGDCVSYRVHLTRTRCHFGGSRPWFLCPGVECGRRCAVLFRAGRYFVCRRCGGLTYQTQRERRDGRLALKAGRLLRRAGCTLTGPMPPKPRGEHWRTFDRRAAAAKEARACFVESLEPLKRWIERHRPKGNGA